MKENTMTYVWRGKKPEKAFPAGFYMISVFKGQLKYIQIKLGRVIIIVAEAGEEPLSLIPWKVKCN